MAISRPRFLLLTTFGLGHMRPASGTWGSIPPVALALGLIAVGLAPAEHPVIFNGIMLAIVLLFSHVCIHQGDEAEAWFGHDPSEVVADETAGQALVLMFIPLAAPVTLGDWFRTLVLLAVAFLAFRILDILKPPPANGLQRLPGGWGILIDDLVVAVPAWGIVQLVALWLL